jgi:hypothetical protein
MSPNISYGWSLLATAAPFLAIPALFLIFYLRRIGWRLKKSMRSKRPGFRPSYVALGNALQTLEVLTRPNVDYVLEQKYDEDADEDDEGDPDDPAAQLNRQLRRIRRGEHVDRLVLRWKSPTRS